MSVILQADAITCSSDYSQILLDTGHLPGQDKTGQYSTVQYSIV